MLAPAQDPFGEWSRAWNGKSNFDVVSFIIRYETGEADEDEIIEGFQHLIDTGTVWHLQGHYGRTAAALIEAGICKAA